MNKKIKTGLFLLLLVFVTLAIIERIGVYNAFHSGKVHAVKVKLDSEEIKK